MHVQQNACDNSREREDSYQFSGLHGG